MQIHRCKNLNARMFEDDGQFVPNSRLPLVIYRGVLELEDAHRKDPCASLNAHIRLNGWDARWVWSIYDFTHYHPDCHEMLSVIKGSAYIQFGGPVGGEILGVQTGDVVIIPAGVGHMRMRSTEDFAVVGAYPTGCRYTTFKSWKKYAHAKRILTAVLTPSLDPLYGARDGIALLWKH